MLFGDFSDWLLLVLVATKMCHPRIFRNPRFFRNLRIIVAIFSVAFDRIQFRDRIISRPQK